MLLYYFFLLINAYNRHNPDTISDCLKTIDLVQYGESVDSPIYVSEADSEGTVMYHIDMDIGTEIVAISNTIEQLIQMEGNKMQGVWTQLNVKLYL